MKYILKHQAALAFILALITAFIGIYQYSDAKEKEFKKTFYEERFKTYSELSETVAKIATLPHKSQEQVEAVQRFWQLTFGKVRLVSDAKVEEAIQKTSNWIVFCVEEKATAPKGLCYDVAGNGYAIWIADAARNSIISTSEISLKKLDEKNLYQKLE